MGRIIAVDYGTKRVGLAVTDPLKIIATPLETVATNGLMEFLISYSKKEEIDEFVVGMPFDLKGGETDATRPVKRFVNKLKKTFPDKKVNLQDEKFTSKMAEAAMIEGGMKKKDRRKKENVDKISAAIILQTYLERK